MRKLLNIFLALAVLLILILIIMPLGMGFWLQNHYQTILDRLTTNSNVSLKVVSFQRGWFRSLAKTELIINDPQLLLAENQPLKFTIIQSFKHGPILMGQLNGAKKQIYFGKALIETSSTQPNLTFNSETLLHFSGRMESFSRAEQVAFSTPLYQIQAQKITTNQSIKPNRNQLRGDMNIQALNFDKIISPATTDTPAVHLAGQLNNFTLRWNLQRPSTLWYGEIASTIDHLQFSHSSNPAQDSSIDNLSFFFTRSLADTTTSIIWKINANQLKSAYINFSPVTINVALLDMNSQSLINLTEILKKVDVRSSDPFRTFSTVYPPLVDLLRHGMTIKINPLKLTTSTGIFLARAKIYLPPSTNPNTNLLTLLNTVDASMQFRVPQIWLTEQLTRFYQNKNATPIAGNTPAMLAGNQIQSWLTSKMLEQQDNDVVGRIQFQHGKLLLNGQPLNLTTEPAQPPIVAPAVVPGVPAVPVDQKTNNPAPTAPIISPPTQP